MRHTAGDVCSTRVGCRAVRWKSTRLAIRMAVGSRGKRGGGRIIYYWAVRKGLILLLFAYPKSVSADLTSKQVRQLAKIVKQEFRDETEDV